MRTPLTHILLICCALLLAGPPHAAAQSAEIAGLRRALPQAKDSVAYTDILNRLAYCYHLVNIDSSFVLAVKARETATRLNYKKGMADALRTLGICYGERLNVQQAITYEYEALKLYRALGDSGSVCTMLNSLSIDYEMQDNSVMEEYYRQEAMRIGSRLAHDSLYSLVLSNYLIEYNTDSTKRDSVNWAYNKLRAITSRYPYSREWLYARMFEAVQLLRDGHGREGEELINRVADTALQKGFVHLAVAAYYRILDDFIPLGYRADSVPYAEKIFTLARQAGYYDLVKDITPYLYRHYEARHNVAKTAYYGQAILEVANRQLALSRSGQSVNYMDYLLKEQELQALQLRNQLQQQAIARNYLERATRRYLTWFLAALAVLLGAITLIYYRSYHSARRYERSLAGMNAAISEKNALLKTNDDFKNKLISMLAHDFRNPLNNVIWVARLLQKGSLGQEEMLRVIDEVEASSRKTLTVFDNILRWIKSQLSGFVYTPAPCPLPEMIAETIQHLQPLAAEKQLQVTAVVPEGLVAAADREMLQFVHRNLLGYAIQLTPPMGQISIQALQDKEAVQVTLGYFTRQSSIPQDAELTQVICKDFIEKMKGKMRVDTGMEETYVTVTYTLPLFN